MKLYIATFAKELVNPIAGRTYWHIREYDICEACKDAIEAKIRPIVRQHAPYSQDWYEDQLISLIEKEWLHAIRKRICGATLYY